MDEQALKRCYVILYNSLHINTILPYLYQEGLISDYDKEKLMHPYSIDCDRINYLTLILPRRGDGWLDTFIKCLEKTSQGTGHSKIVQELESARKGRYYHNS